MVFGRDPTQVTEEQIHRFLFVFVFLPAIGASVASTLLALTAVERVREEDDVVLDDGAGSFILEPFAEEIVKQATEAAERSAAAAIERTRPATPETPAQPAPAPVAPPAAAAAPLRVVESGRGA
jgi:hypothetical protein